MSADPMSKYLDPQPPVVGLLTVAQAAAVLGIDPSTAYGLIRRHDFPVPVIKIGARWKVPAAPLEQLVAGAIPPGHYPAPDATSQGDGRAVTPTSGIAGTAPLVGATPL